MDLIFTVKLLNFKSLNINNIIRKNCNTINIITNYVNIIDIILIIYNLIFIEIKHFESIKNSSGSTPLFIV